ncbi:MAG: SCO family protein [Candidatus Sulfotelmatobacter sp.]
MFNPHNASRPYALFLLCLLTLCAACNRGKTPATAASNQSGAKRYPFKGKVISIDKQAGTANVGNEPIPDFMDSMIMGYAIKPAGVLNQLQPGDTITGEVVVQGDNYWLENVTLVQHASSPAPKPTAALHTPSSGELVPDFMFINQNGKRIFLHQFRGSTLLLTLIYTRCPFPDFCPRESHEFAAIDRQFRAQPARYGRTHLLSISFDPAHDTPQVLRQYGFSCAGSRNPQLFSRWEFAVIPPAELSKVADYFGLLYKEEGGVITHSLSTAVIAPDGKIFKWYHGAEWQASDLLQDAARAAHPAS